MEVLKTDDLFFEVGQNVDCFYSFFLINKKLFSVHRRHRLFSIDDWPVKESDNLSRIILTEYRGKDLNKVLKEEFLCNGNDPRVVSDGSKAYVLSEGDLHSGIIYTLTILPEKKKIDVKLGDAVDVGKNWQPFIKDNKLYIIDSIAPFKINLLDLKTGIISKIKELPIDFSLAAMHDNYAVLRGGANAIVNNETVYGWGHATTRPYVHIPYLWEFHEDKISISFIQIYSEFKKRGYNIVDPTSFFEWDDNYFALGLSCSQREWFHSQWFLNCIVLIEKEEFFTRKFSKLNFESKVKSFFFHATDLDSLIPSLHKNGGRFSQGYKGCLVCGPSKEIDITKKWVIELCYSSSNKTYKCVGNFDVLLNINGTEKQVANTKIYGTNGDTVRVKLSFQDLSKSTKALIQTRVFSLKRAFITTYFFELTYE